MKDTDKYEEIRVLEDGSTTDGRWATTKELIAEVKRLQRENKKLKDAINRCGFNDVEHSCLDILEGEEE